MKKILITGATDGIGLEAIKIFATEGHHLLLHGRNADKLQSVTDMALSIKPDLNIETYKADLSNLDDVRAMANDIQANHDHLDVLVNNAGVLKAPGAIAQNGYDIRFVVNTLAPYLLTKSLLSLMNEASRVINVSSAAQAPVHFEALINSDAPLQDMDAYSQSKLAIIMWSFHMASNPGNPVMIAVNPGSLLASKMVKEGFGIEGKDITIGGQILYDLSLDHAYANDTGRYYDNDNGQFGSPHPDALNSEKCATLVEAMETLL